MTNKLDEIIKHKHNEVEQLKMLLAQNPQHVVNQLMQGKLTLHSTKNFKHALIRPQLAVIAEIKRKSPSEGEFDKISNPLQLANNYIAGGADAISILTDQVFFGGHIDDLIQIAQGTRDNNVPLLRKEFIIDEVQIAEAVMAGAHAVLLIVAVLGDKTRELLKLVKQYQIDALVEVNDEEELEIALNSGAEIIGVNNRHLKTFTIDANRAFNLISSIPKNIIKVAASGISDPTIAQKYKAVGYDAVLIGEALVKSKNPANFIRECKQ